MGNLDRSLPEPADAVTRFQPAERVLPVLLQRQAKRYSDRRLLVFGGNALDSPHLRGEPSTRDLRTETSEEQRMTLGDYEVGQNRFVAPFAHALEAAARSAVTSIILIDERVHRARVYEDSRHFATSASAR